MSRQTQAGLSVLIPVEAGPPIPLSGNFSDSDWQRFEQARSEGHLKAIDSANVVSIFRQTGNSNVIASWKECMELALAREGVHVVDEDRLAKVYAVTIRYTGSADGPRQGKMIFASIQSGGSPAKIVARSMVLPDRVDRVLTFPINQKVDNLVLIRTNTGDIKRVLKAKQAMSPATTSVVFDPEHPVIGDHLGLFVYFVCKHGDIEGADLVLTTKDKHGLVTDAQGQSIHHYVIGRDPQGNNISITRDSGNIKFHCLAEAFSQAETDAWVSTVRSAGNPGTALTQLYGNGQRTFEARLEKGGKVIFSQSYTIP